MQYEVLLRCNGDFTVEEITISFAKLFDYTSKAALTYVVNALYRFEQVGLIHELPALAEFNEMLPRQYESRTSQNGNGHDHEAVVDTVESVGKYQPVKLEDAQTLVPLTRISV